MTDVQKEIDQAFKLLAAIPVAGDHVELMAAARECLRKAYRGAGKEENDG